VFTHNTLDLPSPRQRQVVAPSCDGGMSFRHQGQVVLEPPPLKMHFRDPRAFWYQPAGGNGYWVMTVAAGDRVQLYRSNDLLQWAHLSDFVIYPGRGPEDLVKSVVGPFVETPDLFELPVEGGGRKWVLLYGEGFIPPVSCRSIPPIPPFAEAIAPCERGVARPSSGWYAVGQFNGTAFTTEGPNPVRLDGGPDFYAPQTWIAPAAALSPTLPGGVESRRIQAAFPVGPSIRRILVG
jgi:sucrose-6-phosphate hydrolase SacC (GH32 family)